MGSVFRRNPNNFAPEMSFERTEMGPVIAICLEVERDSEGGTTRAACPTNGEREHRSRIHSAPRRNSDALLVAQQTIEHAVERLEKKRYGLSDAARRRCNCWRGAAVITPARDDIGVGRGAWVGRREVECLRRERICIERARGARERHEAL